MHPSEAEWLEWDDANENELSRHHITSVAVEQVFDNEPTWAPDKRLAAGDWKMVGRTDGGRVLTIIVQVKADDVALRPITGWDSTTGERTRYLRR